MLTRSQIANFVHNHRDQDGHLARRMHRCRWSDNWSAKYVCTRKQLLLRMDTKPSIHNRQVYKNGKNKYTYRQLAQTLAQLYKTDPEFLQRLKVKHPDWWPTNGHPYQRYDKGHTAKRTRELCRRAIPLLKQGIGIRRCARVIGIGVGTILRHIHSLPQDPRQYVNQTSVA